MEFLTAYFANNERTVAKAIYVNDEGNEIPFIVSAEKGNPQWEKILEKVSIDQLHENTYKYIKQSEEDYKAQVMSIAKERGMLLDIDAANTDSMKGLLQIIFEQEDNEKLAKEKLFAFKLALFEFDEIKNSENRDLKTQLRKAETIMDALHLGIAIVKQDRT